MATTDDLSKLILDLEVRLDKSTEKQSKTSTECMELADKSTADWATFVRNASLSQVSLPPPSKRDKTTQKVKYFSNDLCYDISYAGPGPSSVSLKGRLKACIRFWMGVSDCS